MITSSFAFGDTHHITVRTDSDLYESGKSNPEALEKYLVSKGHSEIVIREIKAGIEDCFMELSEAE